MKTTTIRTPTGVTVLECNLNTGACAEQALQRPESHLFPLIHLDGAMIPRMPGFRFALVRRSSAARFHIFKRKIRLLSAGVCWGDDGGIWEELINCRNAQWRGCLGAFSQSQPPSSFLGSPACFTSNLQLFRPLNGGNWSNSTGTWLLPSSSDHSLEAERDRHKTHFHSRN